MDSDDVVEVGDSANVTTVSTQHTGAAPPTTKQLKNKSAIRDHFSITATDVTKVICNLFKASVSRGKDVGHVTTTAIHNHMHYKHSNVTSAIHTTQGSTTPQPTSHASPSPPFPCEDPFSTKPPNCQGDHSECGCNDLHGSLALFS